MKRAMTRDEALNAITEAMAELGVDEVAVIKQIRRGCYLKGVAWFIEPVSLDGISTPELRQLSKEMDTDCQSKMASQYPPAGEDED